MANRAPRILLAFLALAVVSSCNGPSDSELAHRFGGSPASAQGGTKYSAGTGISINTATATISATATPFAHGDGSDGSCVLDGVATCLGMTPAANVYTNNLQRDLFFVDLTVNVGVTLKPAGYPVHVRDVLTLNGTIQNNGGDAQSNGLGGTASSSGYLGGGGAGGNGGVSGGLAVNGGNESHVPKEFAIGHVGGSFTPGAGPNGGVGQGGGGGDSTGAGPGASGDAGRTLSASAMQSTHDVFVALQGKAWGDSSGLTGATGGGGGRDDGSGHGGGGGGGGGWNVVEAHTVAGTGSIQARGGSGSGGAGTAGSGGGGGGGGVAVLATDSSTITVTVDAIGGTKGGHSGTGFDGGNGGAGLAIVFKGN